MFFFALMLGIFCLAAGIAYLVSPRFVEWTVTNDRRGQQWARLLGRERAIYAMRHIFSLILIAVGMVSLYVSYLSYGAD
jgi:heme A synthase